MHSALFITRRALPALAVLLLLPAGASAAQRWSTPTAILTSGTCGPATPCRIDVAVNQAVAGDEVILAPGTYAVDRALAPAGPIDLHGADGQPRPRLVGAAGLKAAVVSLDRGAVRHLSVEATAPDADALAVRGGLAEDLLLRAASGTAATITGAEPGTVLRDAVARTDGTAKGTAAVDLRASSTGSLRLLNVTVVAPSATGLRCDAKKARVTLVNTLVRGEHADVDAAKGHGRCTAVGSNLRPLRSPGVLFGSGNQAAEPRFVDAAAGDYRPTASSPTVDAGRTDPLQGDRDPAGCPRTLGVVPDIGAYEYADPLTAACAAGTAPAATEADDTTADDTPPERIAAVLDGVEHPVIGTAVVVAPARGTVLVRRPGSPRFRALDDAAHVPVGSVLDTRAGRVRLVSAVDADGTLQMGTFWGSRFQVRQSRRGNGMTTLAPRGGDFSRCRARTASRGLASIARKHKRKAKPRRSLWARDRNGRFRTHGENSVATARGTAWLTQDRCDGTLTRVTAGTVAVRDRARHRTVLVKAGHSYLARTRR
jgi:hypothetical protein